MKALLAAALVVLACAPGQAAAAVKTGISEQNPGMFSSPAFHALGISSVRLVVPWNAALVDDERSRVWLETALARGSNVMVAFDKSRGVACPGAGCVAPSVAEYEAGIAAFRARWPQVTDLTPWNEPNHPSQPTFEYVDLAAEYYNAARRVCPGCRLIAGDFLDGTNLSSWLRIYSGALSETPSVWGLHNYWDATYFGERGVDTMQRAVSGDVWLTETGGIVRFGTLAYDEARAADSIRWLYALTRARPRVKRMYLYHWQGSETHDFDGGLVGPDGSGRLGLDVVREELARPGDPDPGSGGDGATGSGGSAPAKDAARSGKASPGPSAARVRFSGKMLRLTQRGLQVGVACIATPTRCSGRIVVKLRGRAAAKSAVRLTMGFKLRAGKSASRVLRVSRAQRTVIRRQRKLQITLCLEGGASCRTEYRRVQVG